MKLPASFRPYLFAVIQALVTTGAATLIGEIDAHGFTRDAISAWPLPWLVAWAGMVPLVLILAPLIHMILDSIVSRERR